ncbi:MAG: glycosyltransferase family 2 protein [Candidatus Kapabacteria bacterium]|nr:glycosyltransferase family 2 protein [Candidatus Kapabacteria bacterium]
MTKTQSISAAIITFNEEDNIGRTLESLKNFADEIIIIDSGSADRTIQIANHYEAKVFTEEWKGFSGQKNSLIQKCNSEWILFLDADEVPTEELKNSIIKNLTSNIEFDGYFIKRKTHYLGKLLKHSWQPDSKLRLVRKSSNPKWIGDEIHEKLLIDGLTSELDGYLIHYSYKNINHHFKKTLEYSVISAKDYYQSGKKFSIFKLVFNPIFAFTKMYFINLAMLDGIRGFIAAFSSGFYTFMKYIHLWEIYSSQNKKD